MIICRRVDALLKVLRIAPIRAIARIGDVTMLLTSSADAIAPLLVGLLLLEF